MKFEHVHVQNFKGITDANLSALPSTIVIAGPNGSGKSSIFDALRLWKSAYAGYQGDEVQWWLQEFGANNHLNPFAHIIQSLSRPLVIQAAISLTNQEKAWLIANTPSIIREGVYKEMVPGYNNSYPNMPHPMASSVRPTQFSSVLAGHEHLVQARIAERLPQIQAELNGAILSGSLVCAPDGQTNKSQSFALEMIFSIFDGKEIGVIDYYGPNRTFMREEVGGINLQVRQYEQQRQHSALYNSNNKYSGVKAELASAYVRDLIAAEAGGAAESPGLGLADTLDELFQSFFPGKRFKGVEAVADGSVKFEVETPAGNHDINDLSSGEKELLYGYLRLRNYAPRNSIILLDEPELHLNPRLTDGLVDFYHRHIGTALNNQLWLVTHSDTILRQSVDREGYKVFHMLAAGSPLAKPSQTLEISAEGDLQRAVIDLVGDLAAYKPGAKIVFLEGGGDTKIDENIITNLFPEFSGAVNLVSSGGKARVRQIGALLERAAASGAIVGQAFAITDLDSEDISSTTTSNNVLRWDRYHIENYLLDVDAISRVVVDLGLSGKVDPRPQAILDMLREAAGKTLDSLVRHEMEDDGSKLLMRAISTRSERSSAFDSEKLFERLSQSRDRIDGLLERELSKTTLADNKLKLETRLRDELSSGEWIKTFRGRDILKVFCKDSLSGIVRYEVLRDLIISKMKSLTLKPDGMKDILEEIVNR